jgi:hypothetical protein
MFARIVSINVSHNRLKGPLHTLTWQTLFDKPTFTQLRLAGKDMAFCPYEKFEDLKEHIPDFDIMHPCDDHVTTCAEKTCPEEFLPWPEPSDHTCEGMVCTNLECCGYKETCMTFNCAGGGLYRRSHPSLIKCTSARCSAPECCTDEVQPRECEATSLQGQIKQLRHALEEQTQIDFPPALTECYDDLEALRVDRGCGITDTGGGDNGDTPWFKMILAALVGATVAAVALCSIMRSREAASNSPMPRDRADPRSASIYHLSA